MAANLVEAFGGGRDWCAMPEPNLSRWCVVHRDADGEPTVIVDDLSEDDARLVAALPNLLAAVEAAKGWFEFGWESEKEIEENHGPEAAALHRLLAAAAEKAGRS